MDEAPTARAEQLRRQVAEMVRERIVPAEQVARDQLERADHPHAEPPVLTELQAEARSHGLWNLFMPDPAWGPGLSNAEYAPICEEMGRSWLAPEAFNCNAPDTGNMELLARHGHDEHRERWLRPLLDAEIRSCFAMTEPDVASSDATNVAATITPDGDGWRLDGRKWWTTNAPRPSCRVGIFMGVSDPDAEPHRRHAMAVVPMDADGVEVVRDLEVLGYREYAGHGEVVFDGVHVDGDALLEGPGEGFAIAQARLGPGRIHHCMRLIGMAERALELMCRRAASREAFGRRLAEQGVVREQVAESRIEIDQARLLTLHAARLMDEHGARAARHEIAQIKVVAPRMAQRVVDRAIQVHGGAGVCQDTPLGGFLAAARSLRIADGPDEVHVRSIGRRELARQLSA